MINGVMYIIYFTLNRAIRLNCKKESLETGELVCGCIKKTSSLPSGSPNPGGTDDGAGWCSMCVCEGGVAAGDLTYKPPLKKVDWVSFLGSNRTGKKHESKHWV